MKITAVESFTAKLLQNPQAQGITAIIHWDDTHQTDEGITGHGFLTNE